MMIKLSLSSFSVVSLIVTVLAFFMAIIQTKFNLQKTFENTALTTENQENLEKSKVLKYWTKCFKHREFPSIRDKVFIEMNFELVNGSNGDDWDILWSDDYPWEMLQNQSLLPHQKVHHFPGISVLMSKDEMNYLNRGESYNLPAFDLPRDKKEFDEYLIENPHKKIVEKGLIDHEINIVDVKNLTLKEDYFYQEFSDNPFLIDGYAFDFLIYVLITSFDPIRAYRFTEDVAIRFCPKKFHPFDPTDSRRFVISNGKTRTRSFDNLREKFKYSTKLMFENLISKQEYNIKSFWHRVDEAISKAIVKSEKNVLEYSKRQNYSMHHFFALARFDFLFDEELNPILLEVNKSPLTIEIQAVYNAVKMIGGNSYNEFYSRFDSSDLIVSTTKNLATSIIFCSQPQCLNCSETFCKICRPCMTPEVRYQLSEAFREHQNSANFKRVFPTKNHFDDEKLIAKMTENNQIQMKWFKGKCEEDERWC